MFDKLLSIVDGESEYQNIWEIRSIRFDVDTSQQKKAYQRFIAISYHVEDIKGNPGLRGHFFLTNLRIIWQMGSDNSSNLSIGLDMIISVMIKTIPVGGGSSFKHLLTVKTENSSHSRFEFKFMGYGDEELKIFNQVFNIYKKIAASKPFRCCNLAVKNDPFFQPLDKEEIKSTYDDVTFYEDDYEYKCQVILTSARIVILKSGEKKMNYGIPWLMIRWAEMKERFDLNGIRFGCRGILARKQLFLSCKKGADTKKLGFQINSFCETFNKTPELGFTYDKQKMQTPEYKRMPEEIEEIETTKININKKKNAYATSETANSLENTEYNQQLGLMMQKLPSGVTRADLWEIFKS